MTTPATDLVTMNIIDSMMVSICREMGITLMRKSYYLPGNSPLARRGQHRDRKTALLIE